MQAFERVCHQRVQHLLSIAISSGDPRHYSLARNVEWDSRVSPSRQRKFENLLAQAIPEKTSSLKDGLEFYKRKYVVQPASETFVRNTASGILPPAKPRKFATVVNLSWLTPLLVAGADTYDLLRDFPRNLDRDAEAKWFESRFANVSPSRQDRFLDQAFAAIFDQWPNKVQKPIWVAEWTQLARVLAQPADDWLRFVGCEAQSGYRQLVIVLQYGPQDGMPPLFRPTQLESGGNHLHFPLPDEMEESFGGLSLNLIPSPLPYHCSQEWIHCPFLWEPEFFSAAARTWGWAGFAQPLNGAALTSQRAIHRKYIQQLTVRDSWMPEP
jgi:hypothetical protein